MIKQCNLLGLASIFMPFTLLASTMPSNHNYNGECGILGGYSSPIINHLASDVVEVNNYEELVSAIESNTLYISIPEGVYITVPNKSKAIELREHQTLYGTRGMPNMQSSGLIIPVSDSAETEEDKYPVITVSNSSRITGLVIEGPVKHVESDKLTIGIQTLPDTYGFTFDNNEIFGFPWAAVSIKSSKNNVINNNYFHDNIKHERGYGVVVQNGNATASISCNVFNANRHAIAGAGELGEGYTARYNLVQQGGGRGAYHQFDMHQGKTGYGGSYVHVISNWFDYGDYGTSNRGSIRIRATPEEGAITVLGNHFKSPYTITSSNDTVQTAFADSIPTRESLEENNAFNERFTYSRNGNDCNVEVSGKTVPFVCEAFPN